MSRRDAPPLRVAPLQRVVGIPVTDPAEIAAIEKMRKRRRRKKDEDSPVYRIAPLQRVVAEPITDPAEIAAIDKMRSRARRKPTAAKARATRNGSTAASRSGAKK